MQQAFKTRAGGLKHDGRLTLAQVLDWLVADAMVAAESAEQLKKERRYYRGTTHPTMDEVLKVAPPARDPAARA